MGKRDAMFLTLLLLTLAPLITAYDFCDNITPENELEILTITDPNQSNEEIWTWGPNEKITINVEIKNKNFSKRNFQVELYLLDKNDRVKNITITQPIPSQTISLEESQTRTLTFSFQLDDPNQDTYSLYAKLFDPNDEDICTSQKATSTSKETTINIEEEEKIIIVRNITGPTNITTESYIEYEVEVINLGNIKEEKVLVIMYNANLNIRKELEIIALEPEQTKSVTFNLTIPKNTTFSNERLLFSTEYDYDEEKEFYYQSSEKSKSFSIKITRTQNQTPSIINQTQNQTTTATTETGNITETQNSLEEEQGPSFQISTKYLFPILAIILTIAIIVAGIFFFLKYKKALYLETQKKSPAAVNDYIAKIKGNAKSVTPKNPTTPSKPSETNTANTKTPSTSQNPLPKPHSPSRPATTSSSPKSTPVKPASLPQATPKKPQTNPPSPQPPKPNKTSSQ